MYTPDWPAIRRVFGGVPRVSPVVWGLGFTSLLTDVSSEMVSSILPVYLVLHLRVSPAAFGIVDGLYQGVAVLVRVAGGVSGDRWRSHKLVATIGYAISAVCRLAMLGAGGAWTTIAAIVAADRAGKGLRTAPRDALISLSTPAESLASAFGVHRSLDAAGAIVGPLVAFLLLTWIPDGYDVLFVVSFVVAALGVAAIVLFVDGSAAMPDRRTSARRDDGSWRRLLADDRFRGLLLAAAPLSLATISDAFIFLMLQRQLGFSGGRFPLLFVGVAVVMMALSFPSGRAADRLGRINVFLAGHVILLLLYGVLLVPAGGTARVAACVLLLGAYYAATDGVLAALASAVVPDNVRGSGLSLVASVTDVGRLTASVLFGLAWNAWGLTVAAAVFLVGLAGAVACAAIVLRRAPFHPMPPVEGVA